MLHILTLLYHRWPRELKRLICTELQTAIFKEFYKASIPTRGRIGERAGVSFSVNENELLHY